MNHPNDAEQLHALVLLLKMRAKATEELTSIWTENDRTLWEADEVHAAGVVLQERTGKLPEQNTRAEVKPASRLEESDDWFWDPFSEKGWRIRKAGLIIFGAAALVMTFFILLSLLFR